MSGLEGQRRWRLMDEASLWSGSFSCRRQRRRNLESWVGLVRGPHVMQTATGIPFGGMTGFVSARIPSLKKARYYAEVVCVVQQKTLPSIFIKKRAV